MGKIDSATTTKVFCQAGKEYPCHALCWIFVISLGSILIFAPRKASSQVVPKISFQCNNISVKDCVQKLPLTVSVDEAFASKKVVITQNDVLVAEGLRQIMDASGTENYVISFDHAGQRATISNLSAAQGGTRTAISVESPSLTPASSPQPQSVSLAPLPTIDELKANIERTENAPEISQDTVVELPMNMKTTLREIQMKQEKAQVVTHSNDLTLSPAASGQTVTYKDVKNGQENADKAAQQVKEITLLNGTKITGAQIKSFYEKVNTTENIATGILIPVVTQASTPLASVTGSEKNSAP